jgi:regulatory protein
MTSTITALKQQKRDPNRVNVYLDGEFAIGLTKLTAGWLQIGQTLSSEKLNELRSNDEVEKAYLRALNFISYRPRSIMEVQRNLRKHEVAEEIIEETIDRLEEKKILDDLNFAQIWVENRIAFRPRGRYALRSELRLKGLKDDQIEQALVDIDEGEMARRAAAKKARQLSNLDWGDFRTKLSAYLSRRGFEYSLVSEVCTESWNAIESRKQQNS